MNRKKFIYSFYDIRSNEKKEGGEELFSFLNELISVSKKILIACETQKRQQQKINVIIIIFFCCYH